MHCSHFFTHDLGKLVCFSQKPIENKEDKSLDKMHFKPIGSSAVVELQKLTDYNSGHRDEEQLHFHFLGKIFELPVLAMHGFILFS